MIHDYHTPTTSTVQRLDALRDLDAVRYDADAVLQELVNDTCAVMDADFCTVHLALEEMARSAFVGGLPDVLKPKGGGS